MGVAARRRTSLPHSSRAQYSATSRDLAQRDRTGRPRVLRLVGRLDPPRRHLRRRRADDRRAARRAQSCSTQYAFRGDLVGVGPRQLADPPSLRRYENRRLPPRDWDHPRARRRVRVPMAKGGFDSIWLPQIFGFDALTAIADGRPPCAGPRDRHRRNPDLSASPDDAGERRR